MLKKKKGFTLIELLAVIVILAVIALIATPLIMNVINDAKEESTKRSVEQIRGTAETTYAAKQVQDPSYVFNQTDVKYKGEQYKDIAIAINDKGNASVAIHKDNKCYALSFDSNKVDVSSKGKDDCLGGSAILTKLTDEILLNIITSGEGLYKLYIDNGDPDFSRVIRDAYIYRGDNPNNYVLFNNELWRIISIEKEEGRESIKLIRNDSIGKIEWDQTNNNNWDRPATLKTYLNQTYYNSLNTKSKSLVLPFTWYIGDDVLGTSDYQQILSAERNTTSEGHVGLMSVTDFVYASINAGCTDGNYGYNNNCVKNNYFRKAGERQASIHSSGGSNDVYEFYENYYNNFDSPASIPFDIHPVVYIDINTTFTSGNGSFDNPFIVS